MLRRGEPIPGDADLVILPGSKSTRGDLSFLREQGWDIAPDQERIAGELVGTGRVEGVDETMLEKAVWLPANYGAFALFRFAEDLTMLGWSLTTSVGGMIPDSIVSAFAAQQLKGSLKDLEERAEWIESVYSAEGLPIYDVYGNLMPTTATGNPDPRSKR
jgi:hypothetical protein